MEAASSAINKILSGAGQQESKKDESVAPAVDASTSGTKDTTVEQEVAPAVEHEHVKKQHETKEQTVVDRERHQDHYHTTVSIFYRRCMPYEGSLANLSWSSEYAHLCSLKIDTN